MPPSLLLLVLLRLVLLGALPLLRPAGLRHLFIWFLKKKTGSLRGPSVGALV